MAEEAAGIPTLTVKIAGTELSEEFAARLGNIKLVQDLQDHHHLEMEFLETTFAAERDSATWPVLNELHGKIDQDIELEFTEPRQEAKMVWKGVVSGIQARVDEGGQFAVVLRAQSKTIYLDGNPTNQAYPEQKLSDVATQLIGDAGLSADVEATKAQYPYLYQDNESHYRFLRRSLAAEGAFLFWDGVAAKVLAKKKPGLGDISLTLLQDLHEFSLDARMMPAKSMVSMWDQKAKKVVQEAVTPNLKGPDLVNKVLKAADAKFTGVGDRWMETPGLDPATLKADSEGLARTFASRGVEGRGKSVRVDIRAGMTVDIAGVSDKYTGKYLVTQVTHTIDDKGYRNEFVCLPLDIAGPRRFPQPQRTQFRIGIVIDIDAPEMKGYAAKVKFPHSHGGTVDAVESGWMRMLMPHAGADHGFAWMPEIDDEVLVAFEGGDLSKGVILGSLYNGKDKAPAEEIGGGLPDNNLKLMTTRSGHKLTFCDESGSEYVELVTGDGNQTLKLDMGGQAIILHTEGELKVSSGQAMSFESQDSITFKASKNIELEATGDIKSESTGKTILKGMEINTDASMKSSLKAGMQVEVKGGSGTVKAHVAGVDVQGPLVKLN